VNIGRTSVTNVYNTTIIRNATNIRNAANQPMNRPGSQPAVERVEKRSEHYLQTELQDPWRESCDRLPKFRAA